MKSSSVTVTIEDNLHSACLSVASSLFALSVVVYNLAKVLDLDFLELRLPHR